ncbi:MAG: hypothetical protein Q9222_004866 [Ikaeria aurantiellina]
MPMMMDDELDALFGDRTLGEIPALTDLAPLSRGLVQRIDSQRVNGCSQKIAWSNQGCIATISDNECTVILRSLFCDPHTGLWKLSEGDDGKLITRIHSGYRLEHLSWNHSGTDLAVTDVYGNVSVFSLLVAINRCSLSKPCELGVEDNLSAVVGLMWLNQDRTLPLHRPAMKGPNDQWAFMGSRVKHTGPHNPHLIGEQPNKNKAAFVTVTRSGVLRLFFQGPDGSRWLDIKGELDSTLTPAELLTHAAIGADKDYSIQSNFIDENSGTGMIGQEMELHHLELLSPLTPDPRSKETLPALLLAFFCTISSQVDQPTLGNEASTSIVRWELNSITPTLHPSFSQLASRKTTAAHATDLQVSYEEDYMCCQFKLTSIVADIDNPAIIHAVAGAFVMQFSMSCSGYGNHHDDLSATMQLFQNQYLKDDTEQAQYFSKAFLSDMHRILSLGIDYSGDTKTEVYLKNGLHQKTLSMQLALGYWGEEQHRSLSSKVAFATLQLRWAALTFAMGLKPNQPGSILSAEADVHRTGM